MPWHLYYFQGLAYPFIRNINAVGSIASRNSRYLTNSNINTDTLTSTLPSSSVIGQHYSNKTFNHILCQQQHDANNYT